jgi:hypothetical protein
MTGRPKRGAKIEGLFIVVISHGEYIFLKNVLVSQLLMSQRSPAPL